jgi:hypothetical protein
MHSSISNFEIEVFAPQAESLSIAIGRDQVIRLLLALALVCAIVETGVAWWPRSIRSNGRRVEAEYAEALQLQPGSDNQPSSVLFVGNSTLRFGLDAQQLNRELQPKLAAHVLAVDGTMYEDWYFCLKELFRKGSHPDYVVLVLPPSHVARLAPPPDEASYYIFGTRDLLALREAEKLNPTQVSNVIFAHSSLFFSRRNDLRFAVKDKLFPGFEALARRYMLRGVPADLSPVPGRFRQLNGLCSQYHVRLMYVIPPTNEPSDTLQAPAVLQAAQANGISGSMPVLNAGMPATDYRDGYHLNELGRRVFTDSVTRLLKAEISHGI